MSETTKTAVEVSPKTEKKVVAKKPAAKKAVEKKATPVAAKSSVDSIKETTTKVTSVVSDAAKSSVDSVKDSFTSFETFISDSRVSGNARAKKIVATIFGDNVNETVSDVFGRFGEATSVCSVVMCSPMTMSLNRANTLYKKITA